MPHSSRSANFDISIRGDELERHRIALEQNLQHTDLSLHLSSAPEDNDYSDVEYPRHNSAPDPYNGFDSFVHPRDHLDQGDEPSYYHAWSVRTMDDDDGVNPYEGRTISTAAHHASALTLSAGLGGRGSGSRRDISMSGAEYDPDRPLTGIIAGFGSRLPGLDADSTKSRHIMSTTVDFDPLVVDDSAEVERVLENGRQALPIPVSGLRSPSSSSSSSRPATPLSPRPKLSDALNQVSFSPKRPRSAPINPISRSFTSSQQSKPQSALSKHQQVGRGPPPRKVSVSVARATHEKEDAESRPKSRSKSNNSFSQIYQQSLSYVPAEPEVNVLPPTPPNEDQHASRFTRMARGLAREIEQEQSRQETVRQQQPSQREFEQPASFAQSTVRERKLARNNGDKVPLRSIVSELQDPIPAHTAKPRSVGSRTPMKGKLYLPDMTGLTSVVASPAKLGLDYMNYDGGNDVELDVRLATTLNVVQSKLAYLESENSISRRRVRELELELEECKRDVVRERTRVLEREQIITQQQMDAAASNRERLAGGSNGNGKAKAKATRSVPVETDMDDADVHKYKEAVEEKKALESLITTLRSHLSRLTAELSDHHRLLEDLRTLRDSDVRALKEKSHDVEQLRQEVERLAGEVEVLRGVVEEGLKERREVREQMSERSISRSQSFKGDLDAARSYASQDIENAPAAHAMEDPESGDETTSGRSTPSPQPSPQRGARLGDRTIHTDQATVGSPAAGPSSQPFISPQEIDRIAEELSERRSERSGSRSGSVMSSVTYSNRPDSRRSQPMRSPSVSRESSVGDAASEEETETEAATRPQAAPAKRKAHACVPSRSEQEQEAYQQQRAAGAGRSAPRQQPQYAQPQHQAHNPTANAQGETETPFPQIRGAYLEKLFFSAPEHNENTCTVCHRRRRAGAGEEPHRAGTWRKNGWTGLGRTNTAVDDEGFAEGSDDAYVGHDGVRFAADKGKQRERADQQDCVPPQTVLARVLRELEDDFTHYKGIYIELADQYKVIDAVSNVAKRNVLAQHLREVIDILEQKGDQIASLYDLLTFEDKPLPGASAVPEAKATAAAGTSNWGRVQNPRR